LNRMECDIRNRQHGRSRERSDIPNCEASLRDDVDGKLDPPITMSREYIPSLSLPLQRAQDA
jgi:hypothetical protein